MLIDLLYFIGGSLLQAFASLLNIVAFAVPQQLVSWFNSVFSQTQYFGGVIDLPVFWFCVVTFLSFEFFWFLFLIAWYVIGFFRSLITRSSAH